MIQRVKRRTRWLSGQLAAALAGSGTVEFEAAEVSGTGTFALELTAGLSGAGTAGDFNPLDALEDDWQRRITAPGVVWYHDFRSDAEVAAFHWTGGHGNDPNAIGASDAGNLRRITTDGITGGCLEYLYPAGVDPSSSYWWRPFAPIAGTDNGKGVDDPAASGTLSVRSWNENDTQQLSDFAFGWYGHPDTDDANFDGHEFYLQIRVKVDPRRITGGNDSFTGGKLVWFTTAETAQSQSNGEHVFLGYGNHGNQGSDKNYLDGYALGVPGLGTHDPLYQEEGSDFQPGSEVAEDWYYSGGWDTLLFHIRPGKAGTTSGDDATHLEIYAAHEGETSYTKVWDQEYGIGAWEARNGLQALILGGYHNGHVFAQEFYQRYCQVIFSKEFIPCPQDGALPAWMPDDGEVIEIDSGTTIESAALADNAGDHIGESELLGKDWSGGAIVYVGGQPYLVVSGNGHTDSDGSYNGILKFGPLYGAGSDNPAWSVFLPGSDVADVVKNSVTYNDGRQTAVHSYNNPVGIGARYYMMATDAYYGDGGASDDAFYFTPAGQVQIADNIRTMNYGQSTYSLGKVYYFAGNAGFDNLRIYTPSTNRWTTEPNSEIAFQNYVSGAIDTKRNALYLTGQPHPNCEIGVYWNLNTMSRRVGLTRPPDCENGIVYDPRIDAFVSHVSGSLTWQKLDAAALAAGDTPDWEPLTFTGVTPPASTSNGIYGRCNYIREIGCFIEVPSDTSHVYIRRAPAP